MQIIFVNWVRNPIPFHQITEWAIGKHVKNHKLLRKTHILHHWGEEVSRLWNVKICFIFRVSIFCVIEKVTRTSETLKCAMRQFEMLKTALWQDYTLEEHFFKTFYFYYFGFFSVVRSVGILLQAACFISATIKLEKFSNRIAALGL